MNVLATHRHLSACMSTFKCLLQKASFCASIVGSITVSSSYEHAPVPVGKLQSDVAVPWSSSAGSTRLQSPQGTVEEAGHILNKRAMSGDKEKSRAAIVIHFITQQNLWAYKMCNFDS